MNPLCCIAPVSIEKDRSNPSVVVKPHSQSQLGLGLDASVKSNVKPSISAQVSSVGTDLDSVGAVISNEVESNNVVEARERGNGGVVAGILYKWVNYGKGWRSRWFVLEDGVLSYYKIHGPDKIVLRSSSEKCVRVIGEESLRYLRKGNGSMNGRFPKQWKPFGEIHLKVSSVRASKSDDKRLSIFTGTKTLHLCCISREDRAAWIEFLIFAKDKFPRLFMSCS